jgi:RHS repeat-associated protein
MSRVARMSLLLGVLALIFVLWGAATSVLAVGPRSSLVRKGTTSTSARRASTNHAPAAAMSVALRSPAAVRSPASSGTRSRTSISISRASSAGWASGDVFAGDNSGNYQVFANDGASKETVNTGQGSTPSTGCALDSSGNLWATTFSANKVVEISGVDPHPILKTLDVTAGDPSAADPESLSFDSSGNFYVGVADGDHQIQKYSSSGTFITAYSVATDQRGSDWTEISSDNHTLFYTSEGTRVLRYDTATNSQVADYAAGLPGSDAYAHRLLPPGDGSGGMLVADSQVVVRLDSSGQVVQTYKIPGEELLFALNLDPDGQSFWTAGLDTGNIYKINIATGAIEEGPITVAGGVEGLCFKVAATPQCTGQAGCPVGGPLTLAELLDDNPSEFCLTCFMGKLISFVFPVHAPTGNFSHTFDDFNIPGRGITLGLSRTYNSLAATSTGLFGPGWSFSYGMKLGFPDAQHVTVNQENGTQVTFTKQSDGAYTAPPRVTASLAQVGTGWRFVRRARDTFDFDSMGRLIAEEDLNGNVTQLAYDAQSRLTNVTDPAGRTLTFGYNGSQVTSVTDPAGRVVRYGYNGAGDLTDVTDVGGGNTNFTYDSAHRMLTMRMPNQAPGVPGSRGAVVTNVYDSEGRVISQMDQLGRKTAFAYEGDPSSEAGGTVKITDPNGHVTTQAYRFSELTAETRGDGSPQAATWKFDYDQATLGMTTVTDPNGHSTTSTFDAAGNTLTSTDAMGRKTTNTYDARNDPLTTTDPRRVTTTMTYDTRGNLLTRSRPLQGSNQVQVTRYIYEDSQHPGDVTAMIDPTGHTWRYRYDAYGNRTGTVDPIGDVTGLIFNNIGWPMARIDARGYRTAFGHNAFGDTATTTDPLGHTAAVSYDPDRNLVARRDASGRLTRYIYDAADQRTTIIRGNGTQLRTVYDGAGSPVRRIDGLGHVTTYVFDPLNRLSAMTDPLGRRTTYTYDGLNNRLSLTNPQRQTTTYRYDPANELTSVGYSDRRTHKVSLAYDPDGNRTVMTDGTGTSHYTYDLLNRMTRSTDGRGVVVSYGYDLRGDRTTIVYPGRRGVTRRFDGAGRLAAVRDWLGHTTTFSYDRDGDLTAEHFPGRATDTFSYDRADRLGQITDGIGRRSWETFHYHRDASGLLTSDRSNGRRIPFASHQYHYGGLAQLSRVDGNRLRYSAADNLTVGATGTRLAYDRADEVTRLTAGRGSRRARTTFTYDARGNRTASRTPTPPHRVVYRYDQENRLDGYGHVAKYAYDGDGLRMRATVRGERRAFVWDLADSRPMLVSDGRRFYVYGPASLPLEQVDSHRTLLYYHHDQLGSTRALTDLRGRVRAAYSFGAYGELGRSVAPRTTPLQFAGEYRDSESGLYYLRARYYDPLTAQFVSVDPQAGASRARYAYAAGDPINETDPTGRDPSDPESYNSVSPGWKGRTTVCEPFVTPGHSVPWTIPVYGQETDDQACLRSFPSPPYHGLILPSEQNMGPCGDCWNQGEGQTSGGENYWGGGSGCVGPFINAAELVGTGLVGKVSEALEWFLELCHGAEIIHSGGESLIGPCGVP